jgi:hypothetical protein
MFLATMRSEVLVESTPDAFVGVDQRERAVALVNRQTGWLLGGSHHEVSVGASRIDAGDAVLGDGCA